MAIKYTQLGHVAYRCRDFDVMYDFYINKLGLKEAFALKGENGERWLTYVAVGDQYLELFDGDYGGDNAYASHSQVHFCFEVGDFEKALESMEANGIVIHERPMGPVMEKPYRKRKRGMCGSLCAFIVDPEGNWIEVMQFTPGSMQILCDDHYGEGCAL